jgi:hypothetical protein
MNLETWVMSSKLHVCTNIYFIQNVSNFYVGCVNPEAGCNTSVCKDSVLKLYTYVGKYIYIYIYSICKSVKLDIVIAQS